MILCEKCAENSPSFYCLGSGNCEKHGKFSFIVNPKLIKTLCPKCAEEKGVCQKCGCDLKT